jgi:uncharacterized protein YhaN
MMRLVRLDLTRYGKFTDHSINFGERETGRPDLHIVYGPNEAGKSTALAAFLDLLFGIEPRSRFNFLHPYPVMRIGASLAFAGQVHDLVRIKRAQNDLLDDGGRPMAESVIVGQLGGIDRESYRSMFSLDDETLEAGGESILASKGDLGQLLFSASTGLADLSHALGGLRAEADGFYKYHARAGELSTLKVRLAALKEQREQIDTAASAYAQLVETRDRALVQYEEAIANRTAIQTRMDEIQRCVSALPRLVALRAAREQLLPWIDLPAAPVGWREALPELQAAEIETTVRSETIDGEIDQRLAELEAVVVNEAALKLADRVDRMGDLHARYVTAGKDIPMRGLEVREQELAIAGILGRIGREGDSDPQRLVFDAATAGGLQDLIAKQSGVEAATQAAAKELSEAEQRLEDAVVKLRDAGGGTSTADAPLTTLTAVVATLQTSDHAVRRRAAERSRADNLAALADRLLALRPWQGDIELLAAVAVPEANEILHWKTALAAAQKQNDQCEDEVERLKTEQLQLEAERDAIVGVAGIVSDQDAGRIRAQREVAWADHRRMLEPASADIFEAALRRDDIVMDARLRHEADVAKLHQTSHALALVVAKASRSRNIFETAAGKLQRAHDDIAAAATPFLPSGTTVVQFEAWLTRREKALEVLTSLKQAERDLRAAEEDSDDVRRRLTNALDTAGVKHDAGATIDELHAIAQDVLGRETGRMALKVAVEDRRRDVKARERNFSTASERDRAWQAAWVEACASCWLGQASPPPSPATVREILPAVTALGHALQIRASLVDRVNGMQDDQRAFASEVAAIAWELDLAPDDDSPLDLAQRITDCVQEARTAYTLCARRTQALEEARERQRALAEARAIHGKRKAEMTAFFDVASLTDVAARLSDIEKKAALQSQADAAEQEILDALRRPLEEAESILDNADRAALDAELVELKGRFADQDQRTRDLFSAHSKAVDQVEAVGGDAAVAMIEEQRRTVLLEIEEGAIRYLRLRVGIVAAEHALRSYRKHHRSSMMAHASEAFRTISRDAYSGLASQPNKENEILIAVAADGSSKIASELSKGTRFQLYLALRVAGYHEFARLRPPVPFIADDIMETFDDFRSEEALRVLAKMGEVGQVIYLTHHRHVCDIAHRICPGVQVHELSPVPIMDTTPDIAIASVLLSDP